MKTNTIIGVLFTPILLVLIFTGCEKDEEIIPEDQFIDSRDGKTYKTVIIGSQTWMAENLNYDAGSGCWIYDNNPSYAEIYGRLYDWETACNVCPDGWHLPSRDDWKELKNFLGGDLGGKLKEEGTIHWNSPNTGATNESGFTALPGGRGWYSYTTDNDKFVGMGNRAYFWTTWELSTFSAIARELSYDHDGASNNSNEKFYGHSVRCVKDSVRTVDD